MLQFILLGFFLSAFSATPDIPTPKGFIENERVEGDINGDQKPDLIVTWTSCDENCPDDETKVQTLTQIFLNQSGKYEKIAESTGVVCYHCGGAKGEPFIGSPSITAKGLIEFAYEGGSRTVWTTKFKWRWQKNSLQLIGYTNESADTLREEGAPFDPDSIGDIQKEDINFSTKRAEIQLIGKDLKLKKIQCRLANDYQTPSFDKFKYGEFKTGTSECLNEAKKQNRPAKGKKS